MIKLRLTALRPLDRRTQVGRRVEPVERLVSEVREVIVKAPHHIADVASDINVLGLGAEHERAQWQMSLMNLDEFAPRVEPKRPQGE